MIIVNNLLTYLNIHINKLVIEKISVKVQYKHNSLDPI